MKNDVVCKIGRRKGSSWGKPHRGVRTTANRGSRTVLKRDLANSVKNEVNGYETAPNF